MTRTIVPVLTLALIALSGCAPTMPVTAPSAATTTTVSSGPEAPTVTIALRQNGILRPLDNLTFTAEAASPGGSALSYKWSATTGSFSATDAAQTSWKAPVVPGTFAITVVVTDAQGRSTTATRTIATVSEN
jgi:hypothetical protein